MQELNLEISGILQPPKVILLAVGLATEASGPLLAAISAAGVTNSEMDAQWSTSRY